MKYFCTEIRKKLAVRVTFLKLFVRFRHEQFWLLEGQCEEQIWRIFTTLISAKAYFMSCCFGHCMDMHAFVSMRQWELWKTAVPVKY